MDKISTILVPYDFSLTSEIALNYAVSFIGKNRSMKLVLGHITENTNAPEITEKFNVIAKKYNTHLKFPLELVSKSGTLPEAILDIQKTKKLDLIIMGTSGSHGNKERTTTKTAELVLQASCPVIAIPQDTNDFKLKNIALVLGTDEIDDKKALGVLLDVARKFNAKVHVLTIENKPGTYGYSEADEKNENLLEYYLESFYSHRVFIENNDLVEGIFSYVSEKEIDMIAILPRNHTKNISPSKGKLTHALTLQSEAPILAID